MHGLTQLVALLLAVISIPVALERFTLRARLRAALSADAALLDKLPKESSARVVLISHLERQVRQLVALEAPGARYRKRVLIQGAA